MLESLRENLLTDLHTPDLRVIIISGKTFSQSRERCVHKHTLTLSLSAARGPVFSSGHDLGELTSARGRKHHIKVFQTCSEVMTLIQDLPVPVIAMVNGVATAAGCQLVASCDIAVPTDKSTFATPGMSVGLFCSTPAVSIGRALPRKVMIS
ncbi:enoyl-CoA hydratase domain-containing protein 3, mitochondrial-like isoform X1 [Pimephales promelas]|uniref:enoyl-CoA hydratase domain-containing protein 3, mitochondrial-like isoform X1 n=1 Tax=Pimephales promelas TaxID=90988 RepID=UPI001955F3A5|nr:enoyl-CoA hydratase domain-containing protein 3, mitochondrial-like isoform X1 [Pimephales promelas]